MPWVCENPRCQRITKGFPNGRKYCWVCVRCEKRMRNKYE